MGLLSAGEPMSWEEMKPWQLHVRKYGVKQFIKLYNRLKVGLYIIRGQTVFQTVQ